MPFAFLLALQASGMVVDWLGRNQQIELSRMGAEIEQAGINANIATSRVQAEDQSLMAMKQLRQNLGTQAALLAARGIRSGAGNAALAPNESIGNFNADQRMARINQLAKEAQYRASGTLSKLHQQTFENNTWNEFRSNVINKIPTNAFGGGSSSPFAGSSASGFGLTRV